MELLYNSVTNTYANPHSTSGTADKDGLLIANGFHRANGYIGGTMTLTINDIDVGTSITLYSGYGVSKYAKISKGDKYSVVWTPVTGGAGNSLTGTTLDVMLVY